MLPVDIANIQENFTVTHRTLQRYMATVGCSGFVHFCISMVGHWARVSDHWRMLLYTLHSKAVRSNLVDTRSVLFDDVDIVRKCTGFMFW